MQLTVFNGSPRRKRSNTDVFLQQFYAGINEVEQLEVSVHYLYPANSLESAVQAFIDARRVLLAFPLYVDAMPSGVKSFIESLQPFVERENNPEMLFFVQSGFPEAFHSRAVERYLLKLAQRMGSASPGCIIKGGGEGVKEMPAMMTKGVFRSLHQLGSKYAQTGKLDSSLLKKVAGVERYGWFGRMLAGWFLTTSLSNFWWHKQMDENDCRSRDSATPLAETRK